MHVMTENKNTEKNKIVFERQLELFLCDPFSLPVAVQILQVFLFFVNLNIFPLVTPVFCCQWY